MAGRCPRKRIFARIHEEDSRNFHRNYDLKCRRVKMFRPGNKNRSRYSVDFCVFHHVSGNFTEKLSTVGKGWIISRIWRIDCLTPVSQDEAGFRRDRAEGRLRPRDVRGRTVVTGPGARGVCGLCLFAPENVKMSSCRRWPVAGTALAHSKIAGECEERHLVTVHRR